MSSARFAAVCWGLCRSVHDINITNAKRTVHATPVCHVLDSVSRMIKRRSSRSYETMAIFATGSFHSPEERYLTISMPMCGIYFIPSPISSFWPLWQNEKNPIKFGNDNFWNIRDKDVIFGLGYLHISTSQIQLFKMARVIELVALIVTFILKIVSCILFCFGHQCNCFTKPSCLLWKCSKFSAVVTFIIPIYSVFSIHWAFGATRCCWRIFCERVTTKMRLAPETFYPILVKCRMAAYKLNPPARWLLVFIFLIKK